MRSDVRVSVVGGRRMMQFGEGPVVAADHAGLLQAAGVVENLRPTVLGLAPSFGYGDRTGWATPGHAAAHKRAGKGMRPIFAQQSIREMTRTKRTPQGVMDDALFGVLQAAAGGWRGVHGADADHLKTPEDVDRTAAAGFTFFTIDPSEEVDPKADDYGAGELLEKFKRVHGEVEWFERYRGKTVQLRSGAEIHLTEQACMRAAVKYGRAINRAVRMAGHIAEVHNRLEREYEIELSVDETPQATTLAEHYIIADQCVSRGMKLVSLAPRFVGDFEKGVDYKGALATFERSLADHAAIAEMVGPYKLSLHSGSDKLTIYTSLARLTKGRFHVKTAGTSYLEALRVVARHDEKLFRAIVDFARGRYETDRATYHVSATLGGVPAAEEVKDPGALEELCLGTWANVKHGAGFTQPGRQILHCTFGSVLTEPVLGPAVRAVLEAYPGTYETVLEEHFVRHLEALGRGM